jgi:hypothetical protein
MSAVDRLAKATETAKKNAERKAEKEALMSNTTTNADSKATTGAKRPKFTSEVTATTSFTIKKAFPFENLGKVFKEVIIESQDCVSETGAFKRMQAKFIYRFEALSDVMGTPSLNINFYDGSKSISKNAEYDIDGKQGKYRKLNGWNGKASISKEAVNFVQALIDQKRI